MIITKLTLPQLRGLVADLRADEAREADLWAREPYPIRVAPWRDGDSWRVCVHRVQGAHLCRDVSRRLFSTEHECAICCADLEAAG